MEVGRVQETFAPAVAASPSKGDGPFAGADRDAVSDHVMLRQFLCLEAMPLDDNAAPSEWHAAQHDRSQGRARKPFPAGDVNQLDVAGALTVTVHSWIAHLRRQWSRHGTGRSTFKVVGCRRSAIGDGVLLGCFGVG